MPPGISCAHRASCPVNHEGTGPPASGKIQVRAKVEHAAPLGIQHNQITGCVGSKVSCGFYRRKPSSQCVDKFAMTIFAPDLELQRKSSQRENVPGGDGEPQQM